MAAREMVPARGEYAPGVIVVVRGRTPDSAASDLARTTAERVASAGDAVELVAAVPADAGGDRYLLGLRTAKVGHAAVLRTPAPALEPADLDLALRYLPDVRAIVLVDPSPGTTGIAAASAAWSGAGLVVVGAGADGSDGADDPGGSEGDDRTITVAGPAADPDGAFAGFVAALAIRLAGGASPAGAWADATGALGVEAVSPSGS